MNGWGTNTFAVPLRSVSVSDTLPLANRNAGGSMSVKVYGINRKFLVNKDGYFPDPARWNYLFFAS